jgi:probable rRNA maturation factor
MSAIKNKTLQTNKQMNYQIDIQNMTNHLIPSEEELSHWMTYVLQSKLPAAEINLRIVDPDEIRQLNKTYRHKDKPTNVLSFPLTLIKGVDIPIPPIGDIIICAEIVKKEAIAQDKSEKAHWAHMIIHGILHLLGYDHETDSDAEKMEQEEITILHSLGFPNPYQH